MSDGRRTRQWTTSPVCTETEGFWAARSIARLEDVQLAPGSYRVRVATQRVAYATLRLSPTNDRLAPLFVPLDPLDDLSYGKVFLTTFPAAAAELILEPPGPPDETVSIHIEELSLHRLVRLEWRKVA